MHERRVPGAEKTHAQKGLAGPVNDVERIAGLTLPSSGRPTGYALRMPLMSNVRPRMKTVIHCALSFCIVPPVPPTRVASRCLPARNPRRLYPAASSNSRKLTRRLIHRSDSLSSRCRPRAEGGHLLCQLVVCASRGLNSQLVVGAPRHSAAPGSQSVGAAGYGSIVRPCCYSSPMLSKFQLHVFRREASCPRARPNPSIERTRTGRALQALISFWALRALPARAAHVKR